MSKSGLIFGFAALFMVAFAVYYIPTHFRFKRFCERLAKIEGRTADFHDLSRDEGGLNRYEIEVFRNISRNVYSQSEDPEIVRQADELRRKFGHAYALGFIFIVVFIAATAWL